jgi:hypothetical protein
MRRCPDLNDLDLSGSLVRSLRAACRREEPFRHWRLEHLFPEPVSQILSGLPFATETLDGPSGRRELHNDQRRYFAGPVLREHPVAARIAAAFQSMLIVQALMLLTGAALLGTYLRLEYAMDLDGFWLEPHTDLGVKALSILFQLGDAEQQGLGTDLYFGPEAWAERVPFGWNTAIIFVPTDRSWHGFEPRPINGVRRSLIVNYVTEEWRERGQLAFPAQPVGGGQTRAGITTGRVS